MFLARLRNFLLDNQIIVVLVALVAGAAFPHIFLPLAPYATAFLISIFFISGLRLDLNELVGYAKDLRLMAAANFLMLVFMPIIMWLPPMFFAPDWALPFLIVGAVPTGLTVALIANVFGGRPSLAMLIAVTTSLLSPITIPLIFQLCIGQSVAIPVLPMFSSLVLTIVIPSTAALLVRWKYSIWIRARDFAWQEISLFIFALLIAGITADTVRGKTIPLGWDDAGVVIVMIVFMGGIAWLSYAVTAWRKPAERITVAMCMIYMNNTLALYIGNQFFKEQNVVPKLLVILAAVNALLLPLKWAATYALRKTSRTRAWPRRRRISHSTP